VPAAVDLSTVAGKLFRYSKLVRAFVWGAHASGVLVAACCGDELPFGPASESDFRSNEKVRDRRMLSPALRM